MLSPSRRWCTTPQRYASLCAVVLLTGSPSQLDAQGATRPTQRVEDYASIADAAFSHASSRGETLLKKMEADQGLTAGTEAGFLCGQFLIAEGDSWFAYPHTNVVTELGTLRWHVLSDAQYGDTLEDMVYGDDQMRRVYKMFHQVKLELRLQFPNTMLKKHKCKQRYSEGQDPKTMILPDFGHTREMSVPSAILLSGGGNDLLGSALSVLLEHNRSGAEQDVNADVMAALRERSFRTWIEYVVAISKICHEFYGDFCGSIPILVHGYDYVKPSGRGYKALWFWTVKGPWLKPTFESKERGTHAEPTIKSLIDEYNQDLCNMENEVERMRWAGEALNPVLYVDVRGVLIQGDWVDEIHPNRKGARKIAKKMDKAIRDFHKRKRVGNRNCQ